jgi:16S rRNA processing protein RimM
LADPHFLVVGQIVRGHGVRGELRVKLVTHYPERLAHLEELALSVKDDPDVDEVEYYEVENTRNHQDHLILKLEGIDDRNEADLLRGRYILVPLDEAVPLEEDEYYYFQLIGLRMVTDQGEDLGEITEILETGANNVYVVKSTQYGELLIPAIEPVVQKIDLETKQIIITPLPGLLPDRS